MATIHDPKRVLLQLAKAIYETVLETCEPNGTPETPIFIAMAERGIAHAHVEQLIEALESLGVVRRANHTLWALPEVAQRIGFA